MHISNSNVLVKFLFCHGKWIRRSNMATSSKFEWAIHLWMPHSWKCANMPRRFVCIHMILMMRMRIPSYRYSYIYIYIYIYIHSVCVCVCMDTYFRDMHMQHWLSTYKNNFMIAISGLKHSPQLTQTHTVDACARAEAWTHTSYLCIGCSRHQTCAPAQQDLCCAPNWSGRWGEDYVFAAITWTDACGAHPARGQQDRLKAWVNVHGTHQPSCVRRENVSVCDGWSV